MYAHMIVLLCAAATWPACASRSDDARPPLAAPQLTEPPLSETAPVETAPTGGKKVRAPVELALTASGARDALTLSLHVKATADIPRAVGRFVLPERVVLVSGSLEQELGALERGAERTLLILVRAPNPGAQMFAAGVDCHLSPGVKLYGVTQVTLAAALPEPGRDKVLDGEGLRASPARAQR